MIDKWHHRFLDMAKLVASWSKDPSTQTGAVIVSPDRTVVSVGYNGFPRGVEDQLERYENRELKYKMIVHCERNALLFANQSLQGCILYTYPFLSCSVCAGMVIQSGIKVCVAPVLPERLVERWGADLELTRTMFTEAGVAIVEMEYR